MRIPLIALDDGADVPLTNAPTPALRAFANGCFDHVEIGPSDNPIVAQAIAIKLLKERAQ